MNAKNKEQLDAEKGIQQVAKLTMDNMQNFANSIIEGTKKDLQEAAKNAKGGIGGETFVNWLKHTLHYPGDKEAQKIMDDHAEAIKAEEERLAEKAEKAKKKK